MNSLTQLPFDVKLTLTTGLMADRFAEHRSVYHPDILIEKQANYTDLSADPNVIEAIRYIRSVK